MKSYYPSLQIVRLYAQYRQAESHRKALVFQKRYLVCQVDAFYQTQQAALQLMADMGAPIEVTSCRSPHPVVVRPYIRFRVVAKLVLATLRFQYVRRRKLEYLQAKINKVSASPSVATIYGFSPPQHGTDPSIPFKEQTSSSQKYTPPVLPISTQLSVRSGPTQPVTFAGHTIFVPPSSHAKIASTTTTNTTTGGKQKSPTSKKSLKSKSMSKQSEKATTTKHRQVSTHSKSATGSHATKPAKPSGVKISSKHANPLSVPGSIGSGPSSDPQLMAYIKGLEKLQARLSKTNT